MQFEYNAARRKRFAAPPGVAQRQSAKELGTLQEPTCSQQLEQEAPPPVAGRPTPRLFWHPPVTYFQRAVLAQVVI